MNPRTVPVVILPVVKHRISSLLLSALFIAASPAIQAEVYEHNFGYDAGSATYTFAVEGESEPTVVSVADVQRDLAGSLCSVCHEGKVAEVKASVHFTTQAPNQRILFPGGGAHGMLDRACGLPGTTGLINFTSDVNLGECAKCHTGRYLPVMEGAFASSFSQMGVPNPEAQAAHLVDSGIDCLVCHAHLYKAVPEIPEDGAITVAGYAQPGDLSPIREGYARAARDDTDFDHDGMPDLLLDMSDDGVADAPLYFDSDGDGVPDTPWPTVAQDRSPEAVNSTELTSEHGCLRCHEHARTGYKRGTLYMEGYDVHATADDGVFEDAKNRCTVCHKVDQHKFVRGHDVGGDLAAADYPPPPAGIPADPDDPTHLTCVQCHEDVRGGGSHGKGHVHSQNHLDAIACQTCHIPDSSGITYSMYGHGAHLSFGRNAAGEDVKLITADHMLADDRDDIVADFSAYRMTPTLVWFNGGTSFLAQTLAVRGSPNAKIFPFKPMANGMVFDARFFDGDVAYNEAPEPYNAYNAHSMYRFFANTDTDKCSDLYPVCGNAEVFKALGMLTLTVDETRTITLGDFMSTDPDRQAMAMMMIFPNMINFDKQNYGYEHFLVSSGSPWDLDGNGHLDVGQDFYFDMLEASNMGLRKFQGFNIPMGMHPLYEWYPPFGQKDELVTMKLPDGSLMKMFLQMQAGQITDEEQRNAFLAAVENYPAFSNGVTLGGHGVRPVEQALGAADSGRDGCLDCHGERGVMATPIPVTRKVLTDVGMDNPVELPLYQWKFYNIHKIIDDGLTIQNEDVVAGSKKANVDVGGNKKYIRTSNKSFVLNWFQPNVEGGYYPATHKEVLTGIGLNTRKLTLNGGDWMPVLEPVVDYLPNYAVLGYQRDEIIGAHKQHGKP